MKKTIVYSAGYQNFYEYDESGNLIKQGSFKIPEKHEIIIENDKATIVFLDDNSKGVALCHPSDIQNETVGIKLAYLRAKIESLQKEIKIIIKSTHK